MKTSLLFTGWLLLAATLNAGIVAPGAKLEKLAGGFQFTEGPTEDAAGNVFFVDQPSNQILRWSTDGKLSVFMEPSGRANGMSFDAHGNLIACADESNQLWSIAPDKTVTVLVKNYEGKYLNGPNDVWVAPNGGIFITDPFYRRTWWDHTQMALTNMGVFYLSPDRKTLRQVISDFNKPNGITGTPDGHTLYVSDIDAGQTWRYDIQADGSLTNKTSFCALGSDGMTLDSAGNVYLTGHGVSVFDATGKKIDQIEVPESWTANVCLGGTNHQTLFITASHSLYSIQLNTHNANPAK